MLINGRIVVANLTTLADGLNTYVQGISAGLFALFCNFFWDSPDYLSIFYMSDDILRLYAHEASGLHVFFS